MKRICSICKEEKNLEDFHKSKIEKLGREYRCKNCSSRKCKKYFDLKREKDPLAWKEKQKEIYRKRLEKNPLPIKEKKVKQKKITRYRAIKGSGCLRKDGYRILMINGIRILEHKYIMSKKLGRPLMKNESVHHKNGMRNDNRLENLELWSSSHPSGQRVEEKIEWAKQFLETYGIKVIT